MLFVNLSTEVILYCEEKYRLKLGIKILRTIYLKKRDKSSKEKQCR